MTKTEADACDGAVFGKILGGANNQWNRSSSTGVPQFTALPAGWQTVYLSRVYQEGLAPRNADALAFRHAAYTGKWQDAIGKLRSYKLYGSRAAQEANLLAKELPAPVLTPPVPAR